MQSENFDNRIREAADHHHPNYDEQAWAKMENLLDKHMPVREKKKRRILFFFLLFLFTSGAAWLIIDKPWNETSNIVSSEKNSPREVPGNKNENTNNDLNSNAPGNVPIVTAEKISDGLIVSEEVTTQSTLRDKANKVEQTGLGDVFTNGKRRNESEILRTNVTPGKMGRRQGSVPIVSDNEEELSGKNDSPQIAGNLQKDNETKDLFKSNDEVSMKPGTSVDSTSITSVKDVEEIKKETPAVEKPNSELSEQSKSKKKNSFFVSASVAPDVSKVGTGKMGQPKLLGGLGIGFTFRERLTLRTGFYSARKIYTASPQDYKPSITVPSPDYLNRVDADCKVYEIPVFFSYNFKSGNKANLFVGTGLSTYIMKKESYDYIYKYPGSDDEHVYNWTVADENTHNFSVLTFSLGYERKLGKNLSFSGEPYLKLPISGVGLGKVKLKSAGILFSVNYKLFGN